MTLALDASCYPASPALPDNEGRLLIDKRRSLPVKPETCGLKQSGALFKHILPFFIPMQGCVYRCVYCDQHSISGLEDAPTPRQVEQAALAYAGLQPAQAAFYGGSFTALPWPMQEAYLQAVQGARESGLIDSIRVSTRPDAISEANLERLAAYGVTTVELGIQSFDAHVLQAAGRAYSPDTARRACLLVKQAGLTLGIQLMCGLPRDDREKSLLSMAQSCEAGADFFRIYPTLVLRNTPLATLYSQGGYEPQKLPEAARLCADMLALAMHNGIPVIRLGLNPSPSLEQSLIAGPYHPAFGQLARGALKQQQALLLLKKAEGKAYALAYPAQERPLLFGQKNRQWQELSSRNPGLIAQATQDLPPGALRAEIKGGESIILTQADFLKIYAERIIKQL